MSLIPDQSRVSNLRTPRPRLSIPLSRIQSRVLMAPPDEALVVAGLLLHPGEVVVTGQEDLVLVLSLFLGVGDGKHVGDAPGQCGRGDVSRVALRTSVDGAEGLGGLVVRDHDVHHGVQAVVDAVQALGLLFLRPEVGLRPFRSSKSQSNASLRSFIRAVQGC